MKRKTKILYVSAELSPYASAGGLGEMGRSFTKALYDTGNYEVRRVMPLYKNINGDLKYLTDFPVRMRETFETCIVKKNSNKKEFITYFLQNDRYFYRENIYAYEDDGLRFFFFCRAVVEMLKRIKYRVDIVHINDWHTGFLAVLLKKEFPKVKTVFTIHNLSYHGFIEASYLDGLLSREEQCRLGYPEWLNFMKAGICYSDLLTTVSPNYAKEIMTPHFSCGLLPLLKSRKDEIVGILNGVDYDIYDPSKDTELDFPYQYDSYHCKNKNKEKLREVYGLPQENKPLIVMISRLNYEKGIDLLLEALEFMDLTQFQFILLGSGNPYYQEKLSELAAKNPDWMKVEFSYSIQLAKKLYAAADIYLMPSKYEPCGLGQLYGMRYGAVPIVNPVGGLRDTVIEEEQCPKDYTGFHMKEWSTEALMEAIQRAVTTYYQKDWHHYITNGMKQDFSWTRSVMQYQKLYEKLLKKKDKV